MDGQSRAQKETAAGPTATVKPAAAGEEEVDEVLLAPAAPPLARACLASRSSAKPPARLAFGMRLVCCVLRSQRSGFGDKRSFLLSLNLSFLFLQAQENDNIYDDYQCRSLHFGVPHPSEIAEPRGLAAVDLPPASYPLRDSLDRANIVSEGKLSSLQLEGVQYACQRHQLMLSGGARAGFFLGDGAGVGKGRQISGIIADNIARGRAQHVWLSTSSGRPPLACLFCHFLLRAAVDVHRACALLAAACCCSYLPKRIARESVRCVL
jgi:hypothetical protein